MKELQTIVRRLIEGRPMGSLATLVTVEGSSYRRPGARLLALNGSERVGSISGGCLEEDLMTRAAAVAHRGAAELALYDTTSENDIVWGVGLGCHGRVRVLIEPVAGTPRWAQRLDECAGAGTECRIGVQWQGGQLGTRLAEEFGLVGPAAGIYWQTIPAPTMLFVFGAGDDALPLVRLADSVGWKVVVSDPRPAFATAERFPEALKLHTGPADRLVAMANPPAGTLAVVMSHHYVHDVPVLRDLLQRPLAYVGLLGPKRRGERILEDIRGAGGTVSEEALSRLRTPTGLDLGADGANEVALSIVAEIQAVLSGRSGRPLRELDHPIHE